MKAVQLSLGIGQLPHHEYTVYVSLIPEYILGITVLQGLWLQTTVKHLQMFWGLLGSWKVFMPHFTQVVCPLYVKKGASWD